MTKAAELAKMGEVLTNSQIGGRRNMVINGAMQVAQRGTSETGVGGSSGYFTVDRFKIVTGNTAGRLTMTQDSSGPNGFANSLKLDCTTADTSIASDEVVLLRYSFEGQDVQQFKKGTSDAEKVTVSFFVKGNASATYTCELQDNTNGRTIAQEFSVTTSFTRIILTFNADTTGTITDDNAERFRFHIFLHGGSNYTGGTFVSNTWASTTTNQRIGDNQTSFFDSTDRTFFITGVQLEVGSKATPFEHRSFGEELALCQRYYQQSDADTGSGLTGNSFHGHTINTTECIGQAPFVTTMRATPTIVIFGNDGTAGEAHLIGSSDVSGVAASLITATGFIKISKSSGLTDAREYGCHYTATAEL